MRVWGGGGTHDMWGTSDWGVLHENPTLQPPPLEVLRTLDLKQLPLCVLQLSKRLCWISPLAFTWKSVKLQQQDLMTDLTLTKQ